MTTSAQSPQSLVFDGQVIIVTGAGRGLGRSYAKLLASRGARVVVNNRSAEAADCVVAEITAAGGEAVAAIGDLTVDGVAEEVASTALRSYGRVDGLINNAGGGDVGRAFSDAQLDDLRAALDASLVGPWRMTKAVWPQFLIRRYGRLVFISSLAVLGTRTYVAYATAKSALHGLTHSLAIEGADSGILVNTVMPTALTRGTGAGRPEAWYEWARKEMSPDHVSPLIAVLAHERCPTSGEILSARAGQFHAMPQTLTGGLTLEHDELCPEELLSRFDEVLASNDTVKVSSAENAIAHMKMPPG